MRPQTGRRSYASESTTIAVPTPDDIRQLAYKVIAAKEMLAAAQHLYDEANWRYMDAALKAANAEVPK